MGLLLLPVVFAVVNLALVVVGRRIGLIPARGPTRRSRQIDQSIREGERCCPFVDLSSAMAAIFSVINILIPIVVLIVAIALLSFVSSAIVGTLELRRHWMAAHQGHAPSQYFIGLLHHAGDRGPHSLIDAHMWYSLAASQGHRDVARAQDEVRLRMTPDELALAKEQARVWTPGNRAQPLRGRRA